MHAEIFINDIVIQGCLYYKILAAKQVLVIKTAVKQ